MYRPSTQINVLECFGEPLLYGGQEAFILNMYRNFIEKQIKYTFFTPFNCENKDLISLTQERKDEIVAANKNFNSKFRKFYITKEFKRLLQKKQFDVVHIHTGSVFALYSLAKIAKKAGSKKVIVHSHAGGFNTFKYRFIKGYSDKRITKYADVYLACSKLAGEFKYPKQIMESGRCIVINNGIDCEKFTFNEEKRKEYREEFGLNDRFVICNIGRYSDQKNHEFLVEVIKLLSEKITNFKVILVGEGEKKEEIKKKIADYNLQDHFIYLERRNDVNNILFASDLFAFPSRYEGLGIACIEAQCTGLYTLASSEVPAEANLTDIIEFFFLFDAKIWVDRIVELKDKIVDRKKYSTIIKEAGFSAKVSARLLENTYLGEI